MPNKRKLWPPPKDQHEMEIFVLMWAFVFVGIGQGVIGILEILKASGVIL